MKVRNFKNLCVVGFCVMLAVIVISGDEAKSAGANHGKMLAHAAGGFENLSTEKMTEHSNIDDAEATLAELEGILDILERAETYNQEQKSLDKQIDITPILFTFNICWLINKAREMREQFESEPELAEQFSEIVYEIFSKADELGQLGAFMGVDGDGKVGEKADYPSWYYHFVGDYGGNANESYIEVTYQAFVGNPWMGDGEIRFSASGNPNSVEFPITWFVRSSASQRFYLSCYYDVKEKWIPIAINQILQFLSLYWRLDGEWSEAKATLNVYRFCESWFCKPDDAVCIANCRVNLGLNNKSPLDNQLGISFGDDWTRSPLLIFTPLRSKWGSYKSPEYFDSVSLMNNSNNRILLSNITATLNSVEILNRSTNEAINPSSSLALNDYIRDHRREEVTDHNPTQMTPTLEAAAQNIGQTWDPNYLCEGKWKKEYEAWRPIPNDWCGDFVRAMIIDYSDLDLKPRCDICGGEYLWSYFGRLNEHYTGSELWGEYRISPRDINPDTFMKYRWWDLATAVQSGYAARQAKKTAKGEKTYHQVIFISWKKVPEINKCRAEYWAIGGCQNESINDKYFLICNGETSDCLCEPGEEQDSEYYDCCLTTDRFWGEGEYCEVSEGDDPNCPDVFCNLFGRTME